MGPGPEWYFNDRSIQEREKGKGKRRKNHASTRICPDRLITSGGAEILDFSFVKKNFKKTSCNAPLCGRLFSCIPSLTYDASIRPFVSVDALQRNVIRHLHHFFALHPILHQPIFQHSKSGCLSTSSIRTTAAGVVDSSGPNSNLVSAMMIPRSAA